MTWRRIRGGKEGISNAGHKQVTLPLMLLNILNLCSLLLILSPLPLSVLSLSPFPSFILHSHRRIKQIVSFSTLLHTSPQHVSLPQLFLTAFILFPPGPSMPLFLLCFPYPPSLIYYPSLPLSVHPNPFIPAVPPPVLPVYPSSPFFFFFLSCRT